MIKLAIAFTAAATAAAFIVPHTIAKFGAIAAALQALPV